MFKYMVRVAAPTVSSEATTSSETPFDSLEQIGVNSNQTTRYARKVPRFCLEEDEQGSLDHPFLYPLPVPRLIGHVSHGCPH